MKGFFKIFVASIAICTLVVAPANAAPSVSDLEQEKAAAENEVGSLQTELTELLVKISKLETDLITKGQEIDQATNDLKKAKEKEETQYEDMKLRIKFMYENGDSEFIEALFAAEDFSDFINKAEYVQNVNTYDRNMLDKYVETKDKIAALKSKLEKESQQMEKMQEDYHAEEKELNNTIQEKQSEIANFDAEIQVAAEAAAQEVTVQSKDSSADDSDNGGSYVNLGNTETAKAIVGAAYNYLGVPYVWGGESGGGLDCSGLVMLAHRAAGIGLSHSSGAQGGGGIAVSNPQPGDIVCYSGHVGIYIGGGQMIHAPQPGDVVKVAPVYGSPWYRRYW